MSEPFEKTVTYAYLRGQLQVCHEAIRDIWVAAQIDSALTRDLRQAIDDATACLPDDMRVAGMNEALVREEGEFDDVLG